jgi:hypothetical protein
MINFIKKLIKWFVVYPIAACAAIAFVITITGWEPSKQPVAQAETAETVEEAEPTETYRHQQCRLELHRENPYGGDTLVWDTEAFGTYDDGSVWVGYNRKVGDRVFRNLSKICN